MSGYIGFISSISFHSDELKFPHESSIKIHQLFICSPRYWIFLNVITKFSTCIASNINYRRLINKLDFFRLAAACFFPPRGFCFLLNSSINTLLCNLTQCHGFYFQFQLIVAVSLLVTNNGFLLCNYNLSCLDLFHRLRFIFL